MNKSKFKKKINKQRKPASVSKPIFANLPRDLVPGILSLLPVKSLARFKCVCKSWRNLISSPKFIKTHVQKSNLSNNKFIFSHWSSRRKAYLVKSLSLDSNDKGNVVLLDVPLEGRQGCRSSDLMIVGSCNGLVCIAIHYVGFLLWNPCTGLSNKLPRFSGGAPDALPYGFGYDPLNDDYKVVVIQGVFRSEGHREKWVRVYSTKSNSWKIIKDFPHGGREKAIDNMGTYINETIHWLVNGGTTINSTIFSLNLGNETYGEIPQPYYGDREVDGKQLSILEGCLSVFCRFFYKKTDIWIMQEYGVKETWTKLYSIQSSHGPGLFNRFSLICISTTGEMLFNSNGDLVLYNPATGAFRIPKIGNLSRFLADHEVFPYVESLVSPQH